MYITIEYMNETKEELSVDDYAEAKDGLKYYIHRGSNRGEYVVPYSSIKKWKVQI